jgi:hypothetical protein
MPNATLNLVTLTVAVATLAACNEAPATYDQPVAGPVFTTAPLPVYYGNEGVYSGLVYPYSDLMYLYGPTYFIGYGRPFCRPFGHVHGGGHYGGHHGGGHHGGGHH